MNFEYIWGMISMICLIGIGYILGAMGSYRRYLDASAKMIEKMGEFMEEGLKLSKDVIKHEIDS